MREKLQGIRKQVEDLLFDTNAKLEILEAEKHHYESLLELLPKPAAVTVIKRRRGRPRKTVKKATSQKRAPRGQLVSQIKSILSYGEQLSRPEIQAKLSEAGVNGKAGTVTQTLMRLRKKGELRKVGAGNKTKWALAASK